MKILLLNYEYPPLGGGGGVTCHILCKEFVKMGHEVDYLTSHFGDYRKQEVIDGINIFRVPIFGRKDLNNATMQSLLWYPVTSLLKGYSLCKEKKYDIINVHFVVPSGPSGVILSKIFNIPVITSLHGGDIYDPTKKLSPHRNGFFQRIVARLLRNSNEIVAQSNNTRENALRYYKHDKHVHIIPLGFVPPIFEKRSRTSLGYKKNEIIIISVGRVVKRKGYDEALRALSMIHHIPDWKYLIVGDGPERGNLEKLAKDLNIRERVIFTGYVEEELKWQYLHIADIYFLSSHHEGFGICLQEAMFSGLSIVSTDHGGQMDFLRHEDNALIVSVRDIKKMARALENLALDENLRKSMRRSNHRMIKEYEINRIAEQYISLFEKAIEKRFNSEGKLLGENRI